MSDAAAPDDLKMQGAVATLIDATGSPVLSGWKRVFGGNARRAFSFDVSWPDGRVKPCIMLSQVAAKHVESDTAKEFAVLKALNGSIVRSPEAVAIDQTGAVTGSPAIVLGRVEGEAGAVAFLRQPHAGIARALCEDLAQATADLHRFDWMAAGLRAETGDPIAGQIDYWEENFLRHRLEPLPVLSWLFDWLRDHAPAPSLVSLVHGDLRPGNFLYADGRVTALLDWEMAHIGDPAEDIGWIYRALWSPERFLPLDEFLAIHADRAGFSIPQANVVFYRIFSEVKFAAISAAAAHGFASGGTSNLRHIDRAAKIPECVRLSMGWIETRDWSTAHATA